MENKYIEKMQGMIEKCHMQLVSYESKEPMRLYSLQNNRIVLGSGMVAGTRLLIWMPQNTLQSPLEQAWDVAHEIGHAMLGHHLANEDDQVKRERDAWNKAECILLAHNIPLKVPDGDWTFSEDFFAERDWALGTYKNKNYDLPAVDEPPVDTRLSGVKDVWQRIRYRKRKE